LTDKDLPDDEPMLDFTEDIFNGILAQQADAPRRGPSLAKKRLPRLHSWFVGLHELEDGGTVLLAHGVVEGHRTLEDDDYIHTSAVKSVHVDRRTTKVIIRTLNTEYHCSIRDCNLVRQLQEDAPELGELLLYAGEWAEATQQAMWLRDNAVLLQLNTERNRFFAASVALHDGELSILSLRETTDNFEDECLVSGDGLQLKYVPAKNSVELTERKLRRLLLFVENVGEEQLLVLAKDVCIELWPGERRRI